jgi:hypothetical protein
MYPDGRYARRGLRTIYTSTVIASLTDMRSRPISKYACIIFVGKREGMILWRGKGMGDRIILKLVLK